ncbi:MAG: hypothetical protein A3D92_06750 [Bacteroidetes bacterium RIFCSPHIGHO2_02_FULL_44_7]|nr:MAG: hypothetical protein A3D92_06750 [Bacteroidetes bacterium RIFCSPHIGHO2_02_FULL_44_7]
MNKILILFLLVGAAMPAMGQKKTDLHLTNVIVIGQLDNAEDRYSLEINLTDMFSASGVKTMPSLNALKIGSDAIVLAEDSMQQKLAAKGFDTYALVSVRGYDRRFKVSAKQDDFRTALQGSSLFDLYRQDIVSISFEFKFFRNGQFVAGEMVKCGNISDRETVLKRFRSKVEKLIQKKWK